MRFRAAAALLLIVCLTAATGTWLALHAYDAPGPLPEARDLVIAHAPTALLAQALAQQGLVASPLAFRAAALVTQRDGPLHAAEFAFPAHASLRDILAILRTAHPVEHRLTIPEGLTAAQIAALLAGADTLAGPDPVPAEGSVLPQTYAHEPDATPCSPAPRPP